VPIALLLAVSTARAEWPEDVTLTGMLDQDGAPVVNSDVLGLDYHQLVKEIGSFAGNKPVHPAKTLGQYGWEFGVDTTIAIVTTWEQNGEPSPWARASPDETPQPFQWIPAFHARKGLPFSTEAGLSAGWVGGTRQGVVSGYGRIGVLQDYKPLPDITLQIGYGGYIGNDQLEVGVLDLDATIGTTLGMGGVPGVRHGQFEPWFTFSSLEVTAAPLLSDEQLAATGAVTYGGKKASALDDTVQPTIIEPTIGGGFQVISGNVHFRTSGAWSIGGVPSITTGMGFTF
jgi:hypothetical protein